MAHSVSRSEVFAGLLAAVLMAIGTPALAKKKSDQPGGATAAPEKAGEGSGQAQDQERPKPILEEAAGPEADAKGNVSFMGAKSGKGKITVKAPPSEKAKVYLEGRYFGLAPRTITKIPPGDYIVEIAYPDGKSVTKPVSVSGDEEAVVELGSSSEIAGPAEKPMAPEKIEKRLSLAKAIGIGAIALAVVGVGLGLWEYTVQKDYDKTTDAQMRLDLSKKGDSLALGANICFVGAGVGLLGAGIIGYPAYKARKNHGGRSETNLDTPPRVSFMLAPGRTPGSINAGMLYRF